MYSCVSRLLLIILILILTELVARLKKKRLKIVPTNSIKNNITSIVVNDFVIDGIISNVFLIL